MAKLHRATRAAAPKVAGATPATAAPTAPLAAPTAPLVATATAPAALAPTAAPLAPTAAPLAPTAAPLAPTATATAPAALATATAPTAAPTAAPLAAPKPYQARRFAPSMAIAMGATPGKPGTVAHWLQQQLALAIAANGPTATSCTVQQWCNVVVANKAMCPSRSAPVRAAVYLQFVNGYLRWQLRHGQIKAI